MNVFKKTADCVIGNYKRFEVAFEKGDGCYLYDKAGSRYLDFLAGIAVNVLGYNHPVVVDAVQEQSKKLIHVSNLYYIEEQADLACLLTKDTPLDKVFFCNSGAEANESAIKIARLYGKSEKYKIVSMKNSFHGRTMATLSATGQTKYHKGFEPMLDGFLYAEFNDFNDLKQKVDDKTVAVFFEFIQGEGGINAADRDYVEKVYDFCKAKDILFIADEVQTGTGRTGKFFAFEHYGIEPDIVTLSKALGGGIPIGAMLSKDSVAKYFTYGSHGSTFGGSPFASYVSYKVVEYVKKSGLMGRVSQLGDYFVEGLENIVKTKDSAESVSGIGLMLGLKMKSSEDADNLVKSLLEKKILVGKAGESTVRLEPPLVVEKYQIDEFLDVLRNVL